MFKEEPRLSSDVIKLVAMLLVIIGGIGAVAGSILGFQTPPSPLWLPVLLGGAVAITVGSVLVVLILQEFIAQ